MVMRLHPRRAHPSRTSPPPPAPARTYYPFTHSVSPNWGVTALQYTSLLNLVRKVVGLPLAA